MQSVALSPYNPAHFFVGYKDGMFWYFATDVFNDIIQTYQNQRSKELGVPIKNIRYRKTGKTVSIVMPAEGGGERGKVEETVAEEGNAAGSGVKNLMDQEKIGVADGHAENIEQKSEELVKQQGGDGLDGQDNECGPPEYEATAGK